MSCLPWIVVACLFLGLGHGKPGPCSSLKGSVFVNWKCLVAFNISLTWTDARDFCRSNLYSGQLAEPVTLKERQAAVGIVQRLGQSVWIGASDKSTEGTFVWRESTASLSSTDDWWGAGQPDNYDDLDDCVEIVDRERTINDAPCNRTQPLLCEIELKSRNVVADPCYPWENALFTNGTCLKMFKTSLVWGKAKLFCGDVDPNLKLVELLTEDDKDSVQRFANGKSNNSIWIGGRRDPDEIFVWDTSPNASIPANLWEVGQPNDPNGLQDCVCITTWGLFNDQPCQDSHGFVCEKYQCNVTEVRVNRKCFSLFTTAMDMNTAQKQCELSGGTLAEPSTDEEVQLLKSKLPTISNNFSYYFLGGNDIEHEGSYVWNTTKLPIGLNWWKDEGNGNLDQNCVCMDPQNGTLDNIQCGNAKHFLCQREPRNPCDEILPDAVYASEYCFKYYNISMTWKDAQLFCLREGSHLAEPTTTEMERNLTSYISRYQDGVESAPIWIGGIYMNGTKSFPQSTNAGTSNNIYMTLSPGHEQMDHLAWYNNGTQFKLEKRPGNEIHGFICQKAAVFDEPQQYVAVVPKISLNSSPVGQLQVTAGYSFTIYIVFEEHIEGSVENGRTLPLEPQADLLFDLDRFLTLPYTDVSSRYAEIRSNQPVTVILYITDRLHDKASSSLIFPVSIYQQQEAPLPYVLFSASHEQPDSMLSVVSMSSIDTDVILIYNKERDQAQSFGIGQVSYSNVTNLRSAKATLRSVYDVMTSGVRVNVDGAYVKATQPVAVFIGGLGNKIDNKTYDFSMDQMLPITYIDNAYFIFPSLNMDLHSSNTFKFIACHDWTNLKFFSDSNIEQRIMEYAGDVLEISFPTSNFRFVQGNASFYVYKIDSFKTERPIIIFLNDENQMVNGLFDDLSELMTAKKEFHQTCITTVLPYKAWRHQYDLVVNAILQSYTVIIYLVVESNLTELIEVNGRQIPSSLSCTEINGTSYSGCHYPIDSTNQSYYHIGLGTKLSKFGAYMHATNTRSAMCHTLGISDTLEVSKGANFSDLKAYLEKLVREVDPQPQTTCGPDVTTQENDASTGQMSSENTHSTHGDMHNATQTSDLTTPDVSDAYNDADVTTKTYRPDASTDDALTVSRSTYSSNTTTTLSNMETLDQFKSEITKTLHIDAQNTSSYRRTKISVPDARASAIVAGTAGIAIIAGVFSLICSGDVIYFVCFCVSFLKRKV